MIGVGMGGNPNCLPGGFVSFRTMRMNWRGRIALIGLAAIGVLIADANGTPVYPVEKSANGHYLVDQNNVPYLMMGDSPHTLMVNLLEADAATFFADRSGRGINTVSIYVLCTSATGGRANCSTIDGTLPFTNKIPSTSTYDLTTPNEAYFAHVDRVINLAAQYGLQVLLDPAETAGFLPTMRNNGTTKCRAYGQYLGNRYKNFPNIIWISGNDFQTWQTASDDALALALARGILDNDTNHLHTVELNYMVSSSLDDPNWASIVGLNAVYTYTPTYAEVLQAYGQSPTMPVFMVEANYESEKDAGTDGGSTYNLRLQEYWTMLSGASGQLYGNHYTWQFIPGWQTNLATIGTRQFGYVKALFEPRAWYNLVPDTSHVVVTRGYGTFSSSGSIDANDYATAASTPDGTLVMVYMPTRRTVTVDMSKLSDDAVGWWYDPASGSFIYISGSPFTNSGTRTFTPPGNNADGNGDWVLGLEKDADPPPVFLDISMAGPGTNGVVISFNTVSNDIYDIQISADLTTGTWGPLVTNIPGIDGIVQYTDTNAPAQQIRFYRVRADF